MILAVNVILLQFVTWMAFGIDGFAFASESLVGKYKGAENKTQLRKAIYLSFVWGMGLAFAFSAVYWLQGPRILRFFTNQIPVVEATLPYLFWIVLFPVLSVPCYIWDGIFIGLTASKSMKNAMLIALAFFLFLFYTFDMAASNHLLWLALLLFMLMRGIIQTVFYWRKGVELK